MGSSGWKLGTPAATSTTTEPQRPRPDEAGQVGRDLQPGRAILKAGFSKGLSANLSGVVWGWLASLLAARLTFGGALAIIVTVLAFVLCVQAPVSLLSFIPGAFAGTAVFFGTSFAFWPTVLALVVGACLGWASGILGERIQNSVDGTAAPAEPADPVTPAAA